MRIGAVALCFVLSLGVCAADLDQARSLISENRLAEARTLLETTVKDPALKGESLVLLTRVCTLGDDWKAATSYGEQATAALPKSSEAHYVYAVALRLKLTTVSKARAMFGIGDYKTALARAIELDPGNLDAREEEIGFLMSAPAVAGGGDDKAMAKIQELKAMDRKRALGFEVALLRKENKLPEAITAARQILNDDPQDHRTRLTLATLLQEAKRFAEAEPELLVLGEVKDGVWALSAQYQRARSRILGRYEQAKAVELLLDFVGRYPEKADGLPTASAAHWRLGNAYEQLAQTDNARAAYQKAVALDPKNEEAKKALEAM